MSHHYEVEIKSLLGSKENADALRTELSRWDPRLKKVAQGKQLNHYFTAPASFEKFRAAISPLLSREQSDDFERMLRQGKQLSIRTRLSDQKVTLIVKASLDAHTSENGVSRIEFEALVPKSLDALDQLLLAAGFTYQAKWSREREEYQSNDTHVTIDKNAGYGYLAEFERLVTRPEKVDPAKRELLALMEALGVSELPQDRLERMFAHYNKHWGEYYGTEKIFVVE